MVKTDSHRRILEASQELFLHYGFKKTTLGEIAKRAGVSRPTLYARFESKEDIFVAVLEDYTEQLAHRIAAETAELPRLADKLTVVFELAVVVGYEKTHRSVIGQELLEVDDPRVQEAVLGAHRAMERRYTQLIKDAGVDLKPLGLTAPKLGRLINAAVRGFKEQALDAKELRQMLKGLVQLVSAATSKGTP